MELGRLGALMESKPGLVWIGGDADTGCREFEPSLSAAFGVRRICKSEKSALGESLRVSLNAVVISEGAGVASLLRDWFSARRNCPSALFGIVLRNRSAREPGTWRRIGLRMVLAVTDFMIVEKGVASAFVKAERFPARRIFDLAVKGEALAEFLRGRLGAEANSILWVDPNIHKNSPAMKNLVDTAPLVVREGWELRVWCKQTEISDDIAEITLLRVPSRIAVLMIFAFIFRANVHRLWIRILKGRPPARLVHSCGSYYLGAEMVSVHFGNRLWLKKQVELGFERVRDFFEFGFTALATITDALQYRHFGCKVFLPVSDSLANEVRGSCRPEAEVVVVPSAYDAAHFNLQVRDAWRVPVRRQLGIADDERLLAFVSQGSYRRKGLWLALDALTLVRARDPRLRFRFMIIGGKPDRVEALRTEIAGRYRDWNDWIFFTGFVPDLAHYLAASDGFLFPSYFESFAAVEVEAAAMGVPLLLTQHFGNEMVLRHGSNGLLLPWRADAIALDLERFLSEGIPNFRASVEKGISRAEFHKRILSLYRAFFASEKPTLARQS